MFTTSQQHLHAHSSNDYDVGTKVYTWRLESTPQDSFPQYDTYLFKEELIVTGPESEDQGYLPSDEEGERTKTAEDETSTWHITGEEEEPPALPSTSAPELTTDSTLLSSRPDRTSEDFTSIPSSTIPEGTDEAFTFVTAEDLPEKPVEEEFTILSKEDIPPLDLQLGISSSDEKEGSEKSYPEDFTSSDEDDSSAEKRLATEEEKKLLAKQDGIEKDKIPQEKQDTGERSEESSTSEESEGEDGFVKPSMPDIVPKDSNILDRSFSSESDEEEKEQIKVKGVPLPDGDKMPKASSQKEISVPEKELEQHLIEEEIVVSSEDKPDFAGQVISEKDTILQLDKNIKDKFEGFIEEGKDHGPTSMVDKVSLWDEESEDEERKLVRKFSPFEKSMDEQPVSDIIIEENEEDVIKPDFKQQVSLEESQPPEAGLITQKDLKEGGKEGNKELVDLSFDKLLQSPTEMSEEREIEEEFEQPELYQKDSFAPEFEVKPKDIFHAEQYDLFRGVPERDEDYEEVSIEEEEIIEEEEVHDEFMGREYILENIPEEESFETSENEGYTGEDQQLSPEETRTKPSKDQTSEVGH